MLTSCNCVCDFFFFKQKTAYELRISDWSSDVCSSDLRQIDTARDVDLAIRWGYGWKLGPFETWQAAGWQQIAGWIQDDIAAGKTMANAPLPALAIDGRAGGHSAAGSFSPSRNARQPRSALARSGRPLFPPPAQGGRHGPGGNRF